MPITFREIKNYREKTIKSKHRKRITLVLGLLMVAILGPSLFLLRRDVSLLEDLSFIKPSPTEIPIKTIKHYFVPVVKFKDPRNDISLDALKASELITTSEEVDIFPDGYQADVVSSDVFAEELVGGKIGILKTDHVTADLKTLAIDGISLWDSDMNLETYPLTSIEKIPGESGELIDFDENELSTIFIGGEIIPARAVDRIGLNVNNNYTYLYDNVRQMTEGADLAIAQLENPLMGNPTPCTGCVVFIGDEQNAKGFAEVGFDFLAASGNHMGDGGQQALTRTVEVLTENNIQFTGIGKGEEEQLKPAIKEIKGRKIGMISADDVAYFYWSTDPAVYGVNSFSNAANGTLTINQEKVAKIKQIKEINDIDYLIVYESWGVEYTNKANSHQVDLAHLFIDNGADLVVASHPHWVQNIEFYKGKPIFYALGNFIFDQTHTLPTRQSIVLNLVYYMGELKSIGIVPLQTCGYHQTTNNLTAKYLSGELTIEGLNAIPEKDGCVYWQPRVVTPLDSQYNTIMNRVFEFSSL